jgi:SAM-dependent methyltransferase
MPDASVGTVGDMSVADRSRRALSFGSVAEDYDRFRPGPPPEAVSWVLPHPCEDVVEIGAGTGALTRLLVRQVDHVTAVEPDSRMAGVLAAHLPGVTVLSGRAEELPVPDGSVDAVVGSSMWHWVDEPVAGAEAARVLRPGGVLGLLWSGPDRSRKWVADLLAGSRGSPVAPTGEHGLRRPRHEVHLPPELPFSVPETHTVDWSRAVTAEELVGLAGTYSRFIVLDEGDKTRLLERLADTIGRHPELADGAAIDLPMRCTCWRAVRGA